MNVTVLAILSVSLVRICFEVIYIDLVIVRVKDIVIVSVKFIDRIRNGFK